MNSTVPRGIYKARKTRPNTTFVAGGQEFPRSSELIRATANRRRRYQAGGSESVSQWAVLIDLSLI
jgi:hypothetical protein